MTPVRRTAASAVALPPLAHPTAESTPRGRRGAFVRGRGRSAVSTAIALGAVVLAGCASGPAPSPTPTAAFASADEAYAAAEKVYRAYNDALNDERAGGTSNSRTYLVGLALESDTNTSRLLTENGLKIVGEGAVVRFSGESADLRSDDGRVRASVCLDVSSTRVINDAGEDVTPPTRVNLVPLDVIFVASDDGLLISESNSLEEEEC